jgi:hypothetical protein
MEAKMIITPKIIEQVEKSALEIDHGIISLCLHIREGQVSRHFICREESFVDNEELSTHNDFMSKRKRYRIKSRIPIEQ